MSDPDEEVLRQLEKHGADLSRPRDTRFYLYVRDEASARAAGERLRAHDFQVEIDADVSLAAQRGDRPWLVLASRAMLVSPTSITEAGGLLRELAAENDGDYDGWEAAV